MAARGQVSAGRKSNEGRSIVLTLVSVGNLSIRILTYTTFLDSPCCEELRNGVLKGTNLNFRRFEQEDSLSYVAPTFSLHSRSFLAGSVCLEPLFFRQSPIDTFLSGQHAIAD